MPGRRCRRRHRFVLLLLLRQDARQHLANAGIASFCYTPISGMISRSWSRRSRSRRSRSGSSRSGSSSGSGSGSGSSSSSKFCRQFGVSVVAHREDLGGCLHVNSAARG